MQELTEPDAGVLEFSNSKRKNGIQEQRSGKTSDHQRYCVRNILAECIYLLGIVEV